MLWVTCYSLLFGQSATLFNGGASNNYDHFRFQADQYAQASHQTSQQVAHLQHTINEVKQKTSERVVVQASSQSIDDILKNLTEELLASAPSPMIDLASIPTPRDQDLPYHFQSDNAEIKSVYRDLYKISPYYENRREARQFGLISAEAADQSYAGGEIADANYYKELAKGFLDIAVGIDPISGFARSTYELFTGKNLITGIQLTPFERSMAFVGAVTIGGSSSIASGTRGMARIFDGAAHLLRDRQAIEAAMHGGQQLVNRIGHLLDGWKKGHKIINIHTAEHVNQTRFGSWLTTPPFQLGSHVVEFETTKASQWVRVHGEMNQASSWVMRRSSIEGLSAHEIQIRYALPSLPTHVSDVHIPAGTKMFRGNIQDHGLGGAGQVQYWIDKTGILDEIFATWFQNRRPL